MRLAGAVDNFGENLRHPKIFSAVKSPPNLYSRPDSE